VIAFSLAVHQGAKTTDIEDRIANHPTVVRASIQNTTNDPGLISGVRGLLYVFNGDTQIPGSPFEPDHPRPNLTGNSGEELLDSFLRPKPAGYTFEERFGLRDTLNFYFGTGQDSKQLPQGHFTFALVVDSHLPTYFR